LTFDRCAYFWSARELKAFAALGHIAIGLDGAARFVEMARD
jgi:hypothetical protein